MHMTSYIPTICFIFQCKKMGIGVFCIAVVMRYDLYFNMMVCWREKKNHIPAFKDEVYMRVQF